MKKKLMGILLGVAILCQPITVNAADAVFARTHEVNDFLIEDAQLLMKVAQAEAGNQGEDGMWLVMSTVVNRVKDKDFPNSVKEVVYQKSQFATVTNGAIDNVEISPECHLALARIESGQVAPQIIGFETTDSDVLCEYFLPVFIYRDHQFYVKKGENNG